MVKYDQDGNAEKVEVTKFLACKQCRMLLAHTHGGHISRVAGTFLVLLVCSSSTPPATAQGQPYQQPGQQLQPYNPQQYAPQSGQLTSQPNCGQCPPGYRPAYGTSGGSVNVFKATIILEDCPPCPPGYISTNGISQPQNFPQQNSNSYNYAQQPPLSPSNYYPNNNGQFGSAANYNQQGYNSNYGPPATNYQQQSGYGSTQSNNNFQSGTTSSGYPSLSFPQGTPSAQQQGSFGYSNNQPGQQQSFTGQTQSNQPLLSSSTSYGGFQPPYYGGAYGQGEQAGGGQPGYLPNYHGDTYTNPQRTQETRALNDPFYQSIGGEPRYPGGDVNTPSMGATSYASAAAKPYNAEKAKEVVKEKAKQRRRLRRK